MVDKMSGEQVVELRKKLALTQRELAALIGVRQASVANWEAGKRGISGSARILLHQLDKKIQTRR